MTRSARSRVHRSLLVAAALLTATALTACTAAQGATPSAGGDSPSPTTAARTSFRIGVGADNPTEAGVVGYIAETLAPQHGISVELVELEDSRHLNEAVDAGELDGHVAIHEPYLKAVLAEQPQWELAASVPVYVSILTIASRKHSSLDDIPAGATVSIPDDPANEAKSLEFLEEQGLLTLAKVEPGTAAIEDVTANPHDFQFIKVAGQQLARSLDDVDYSVVQATYLRAADVGAEVELVRAPQALRLAVILVTRTENIDSEEFRLLRETFEDPLLDDFIDGTFGDLIAGVR